MSLRISGAVKRGVFPWCSLVLSSEFVSRAIVARPKSTIRALPAPSTSILAYVSHGISVGSGNHAGCTYSFDVSMDHVA